MEEKIKVANAPCSWGVLEFGLEGEVNKYNQVLDEIAQTGYSGTELGDWGFMPTDPASLKEEIEKRKLALVGAFVPVALSKSDEHERGIKEALKISELMYNAGFKDAFIVLADENGTIEYRTKNAGRIKKDGGLSDDEMDIFAQGANKIAGAVKDQSGMRTVFHHHCGGYIETPEEIDRLLSKTNPELLGLCVDTGHFMFGGGKSPLELIKKYWKRVWHVHFKDFSEEIAQKSRENNWDYFESVRNGIFCELGKGVVEFSEISEFLKAMEYNGWIVVEQDILPRMGNPKKYAKTNREYLKTLGL